MSNKRRQGDSPKRQGDKLREDQKRIGREDQDIARGRSTGMTAADSQRAQRRGGNRGSGVTGGQRSHGGR